LQNGTAALQSLERNAIQQAFLDDPLVRLIAIFNTVGLYRRDRSIRT
jgi:hypothetical protein